jgi:hypothetical protein
MAPYRVAAERVADQDASEIRPWVDACGEDLAAEDDVAAGGRSPDELPAVAPVDVCPEAHALAIIKHARRANVRTAFMLLVLATMACALPAAVAVRFTWRDTGSIGPQQPSP